jgi:hypothetical protein
MNAKEVIQQGEGWYWWRFKQGWGWRPVKVVKKGKGWEANGQGMEAGEYMDIGEYLPIGKAPEDSVGNCSPA